MRNFLSLLSMLLILASCGIFNSGNTSISNRKNKIKRPMWEEISKDIGRNMENNKIYFRLNHRPFVDSFVHFAQKSSDPTIPLLMELPSFEGYLDEYYFKPIDNPNKDTANIVYGFVGVNKNNNRDLNTLYIDKDHVTVKWDNVDKEWVLRYYNEDSVDHIYMLLDKIPNSKVPIRKGQVIDLPEY